MIGSSKSIWGFDPRSVPGCQLWLDAADTGSMTLSGSSVTQWRDKSGSSNHFTPTSGTPTSILDNGRSVVNFTSGTIMTSTNQITFTGSSAFFIVSRLNSDGMLLGFTNINGADFSIRFYGPYGPNLVLGGTDGTGTNGYDLGNNNYYVNGTFNPSFRGSTYSNVYSLIATVAPSSSGTSFLTLSSAFLSRGFIGNIAEFLYYPGGVTSTQRQQVEGYLAHKWGLTGYYNPNTPLSISGCQVWFDGADTSTITLATGSNVSIWRDKSGLGNNLSNTGSTFATRTTTPGLFPSIFVNGSACQLTSISNNTLTGNSSRTVFMVAQVNAGGISRFGTGSHASATPPSAFGFELNLPTAIIFSPYVYTASDITFSSPNSNMYCLYADYNSATSTLRGIINFSTTTTKSTTLNTTATPWYLGLRPTDGGFSTSAHVCEIIAYNTSLTVSQRQTIEGYLARKWGLTSMYGALPSIHPFSSIRPHLRAFQPTDVDGCQLWLDGADSSSLVLSGSSVTTWNDKSGNGYHMNTLTPTAGWTGNAVYPTIGTSINGLQTVNFVAQSGLKQAITLDGVKNLFWVGRIAAAVGSSAGGFANFFLLGHDSHYDWHPPIGEKFILSGVAQSGIADASPASLFTNDANAVTNTAFKNINLPSPPNVSLLSVSGITGTTRYQGICYDRTTHTGWCGDLAEVLIFSTALTTSQRQQVEGYLAHKWGLTPYLPVISPLSIPGCQLWLDGADPAGTGTPPANGATVSTWVDKASGKNATATGTPTYLSGGGINFNGSPYFLNENFVINLSQRSIFIVMQETTRTNYSAPLTFIPTPTSGYDETLLTVETISGLKFFSNGNGYSSVLGNSTLLVKAIYNDNMSGTTGSGYLNGTNATNVNAARAAASSSGYTIGGRWQNGSMSGSYRLNGVIYEIIVFNTPLTTTQRQTIEGYLANKWGITISATLPSTHPFKSILPATAAHFYPTQITGCTLWLDGADQSSFVLSGSNVTQWTDKSGNGLTVSAASSQPTYVSNAVNGLGTVAFNGSQGLSAGTVTGTKLIGNTNSCAIYAVVRFENTSGRSIPYSWDDQTYEARFLLQYAEGNSIALLKRGATFTTIPLLNSLYYIVSYWQNGLNTQLNVNGTTIASLSNFSNNDISSFSRVFNVGYYANDPGSWNMRGNIAEILFFNTHIPNDFKKVEGYLAHKWGLTSSIPSKHPYRPLPPIFPPNLFIPTPSMYSALFSSANNTSLTIPANSALTLGTNNHTIEFWMYQTSRNQYDSPFIYGNTSYFATNTYYMDAGENGIGLAVGNGAGGWAINFSGGAARSLNTWHHYALVRNGTTFTLYVNGTSVGSGTSSINITAQGDVFKIGNHSSYGITGYITNFRLVNGTAVYTSNFTPPTTPLTAIPNTQILLQGLVDRSPNAFTVTNNGSVTLSTTVTPF